MKQAGLEQAALVALLRERPGKRSWADLTAEVIAAGSAVEVWERLVPATLLDVHGEADPRGVAARDIEGWLAQGHTFLTVLDEDYPERLKAIHEAPPVLFAQGELRHDDPAVSVVGSRAASELGLSIARDVARSLADGGVTVVAGLALGIDTAAHEAALEVGGRTVALIGTGINNVYPATNRRLHRVIAERGLLVSQFWPDAPPRKHSFLMRNATMSGYGIATVVVEAGETSGARAQARMAVEHGRPVVVTDLVVERNVWAQSLVGRPGVHVADSVKQVMAIIESVTSEMSRLETQLRDLALA